MIFDCMKISMLIVLSRIINWCISQVGKPNEFLADFTPSLVYRLSECGWLRLAILYVKGNPVAAQIWFVVHGKANIYRLAYDEQWKKYSPGSILTEYLMRHVIDEDKVSEIDFLTGNERYKQDWMTNQNERIGVRLAKQPVKKNILSRIMQLLKKKGLLSTGRANKDNAVWMRRSD